MFRTDISSSQADMTFFGIRLFDWLTVYIEEQSCSARKGTVCQKKYLAVATLYFCVFFHTDIQWNNNWFKIWKSNLNEHLKKDIWLKWFIFCRIYCVIQERVSNTVDDDDKTKFAVMKQGNSR